MITPGTYLRLRRQASGFAIEDVAALVHTSPRLGEVDRAAWLRRLEDDVAALSPDVIATLHDAFRFSHRVLTALIDLRSYGAGVVSEPAICLICGCSQFDACFDGHTSCAWSNAASDHCTACVGKDLPHAA